MSVDLESAIRFAQKYGDLGWAIHDQLENLLSYDAEWCAENLNDNAVRAIAEFLEDWNVRDFLDDAERGELLLKCQATLTLMELAQ